MADDQGFGGPPGSPAQTINTPKNAGFVIFEVFETLNTKPPRPAIKDSEMAWCDGFIPFGPSFIRTLYGVGSTIYTAPGGLTLVAPWFYNFGDLTYAACLLSDGSLVQVDTNSGVTTQIMPMGTIQNPNPNQTWMTQWNSKYLVIVSSQTNGYWMWDGTNLFGSGAISPFVIVTNSGSNYTSQPTFRVQTTGSGTGATFSAVIKNQSIDTIDTTNPGSGFAVTDFVNVSLSGGGSDTTAIITPIISATSGPVIEVVIINGGNTYSSALNATVVGGGGTGAAVAIQVVSGVVESITVITGGSGYTSAPTLAFTNIGGGNSLVFKVIIGLGSISGATITDPGTNYTSPPTLTVVGDGQGAEMSAVIDNTGVVTQVVVSNSGSGYTAALVRVTGGNNAAEATISLMPFGVQGSTVEVYVNRVWVGNTRKGYFTAPSSPSDFAISDGAGVFQSNDSFQRVSYNSFRQTNGFLYLLSDSSMNYIGGVQTSGSPAITTFNNLNVDPQIGTPWPGSVSLFSRNIVFANSFGIFVSYGGAVTKISGPLDGVYNTVITTGGTVSNIYPSSAIASLFGIAVYMLLLPIIDPYTNQQVNKLLIWDGKRWFTSNQDMPLTYVASQEVNSVLTSWGTDGTNLFPLFQNPTTGFQKVVQSKLWSNPSYWYKKTNPELAGIFNFFNTVGEVSISVDNENGSSDVVTVSASSTASLMWTNNSSQPITWTNNSAQPITWGSPGLALVGPQETGQAGVLMGLTIVTEAKDMSILSIALLEQNYQYRG